jgi:hypothetical protein
MITAQEPQKQHLNSRATTTISTQGMRLYKVLCSGGISMYTAWRLRFSADCVDKQR